MGRGTRLSRKNPILKKSCFFFFKRNRLCGPRSLWQQIPRQGNKQSYPLPCIMHSTFSTSLIKRLEEEDDDGGWKGKRNLTDGELERLDQSEEWRKPKRCFFLARRKKKTYGVAHTTGNGSPFIPTAILSPPPPYSNAYIYKYTLAIIDQILFRRACTCVLNSGFRCGYLVEGTMSSSSCSSRAKVYK